MPVSVFHVDDSESYRMLVAQMLEPGDAVKVVGGAGDPEAALAGVEQARPDVVLLDQIGDAALIGRLREAAPGLRVVILSGYPRENADPDVVAAADGYVVKSGDLHELCANVLAAARGE